MFAMPQFPLARMVALLAVLIVPCQLVAQDTDKNITVLTQGPIHEAYAQPIDKNAQPTPIVPKKPPDPIPEEPPPQKRDGNNLQWIPGYWTWDTDRQQYIWVSGCWRQAPPDRKWVPGHWTEAAGGWQWVPGFWAAANQQELQFVPEPPPSLEEGPSTPAPNADSFYVPGSWMYRDTGYAWRPGFWAPSYADWVWNPAGYSWTPSGCVFVDGYWDYPLASRGVLFAPVCFDQPLWSTPGWFYCPSSVLDVGAAFPSLFVRPAWHHYYFGNFYGHGRHGTYPWSTWGRSHYDPLFTYSSGRHRNVWNGSRSTLTTFSTRPNTQLPQVFDRSPAGSFPLTRQGGGRTRTSFSGFAGGALPGRSPAVSSYSRPQTQTRSPHYGTVSPHSGSMPRGNNSFARPAPAVHSAGHSSGRVGGGIPTAAMANIMVGNASFRDARRTHRRAMIRASPRYNPQLHGRYRLLAAHAGEMIQEVSKGIPGLKVIQ